MSAQAAPAPTTSTAPTARASTVDRVRRAAGMCADFTAPDWALPGQRPDQALELGRVLGVGLTKKRARPVVDGRFSCTPAQGLLATRAHSLGSDAAQGASQDWGAQD